MLHVQQQMLSAKISGRILKAAREQQQQVEDEEAEEQMAKLSGGRVQVCAQAAAMPGIHALWGADHSSVMERATVGRIQLKLVFLGVAPVIPYNR